MAQGSRRDSAPQEGRVAGMVMKNVRAWVAAGLSGIVFCGCEAVSGRNPFANDPLLVAKKPVEGKVDSAGPKVIARNEIFAPAMPPQALASVQTLPQDLPETTASAAAPSPTPVPATTAVGTAREPVPAATASRIKDSAGAAALPAVRRQVPETFGHAPDYTWLQGVLEKHSGGSWELRFGDPAVDDKWGGKVILPDEPRLAAFQDEDTILVEGDILPDQGPPSAWRHFPQYRVKEIWLVQRKSTR
jgi:hypothetical protein